MRMSYDDQYLFSVGQDGSLLAFRVSDKEGRGYKRDKDIAYAEEVLVTKSDLEEKVREGGREEREGGGREGGREGME